MNFKDMRMEAYWLRQSLNHILRMRHFPYKPIISIDEAGNENHFPPYKDRILEKIKALNKLDETHIFDYEHKEGSCIILNGKKPKNGFYIRVFNHSEFKWGWRLNKIMFKEEEK